MKQKDSIHAHSAGSFPASHLILVATNTYGTCSDLSAEFSSPWRTRPRTHLERALQITQRMLSGAATTRGSREKPLTLQGPGGSQLDPVEDSVVGRAEFQYKIPDCDPEI